MIPEFKFNSTINLSQIFFVGEIFNNRFKKRA